MIISLNSLKSSSNASTRRHYKHEVLQVLCDSINCEAYNNRVSRKTEYADFSVLFQKLGLVGIFWGEK